MTRETKFAIPRNELFYYDEVNAVFKPLKVVDGAIAVKDDGTEYMKPVDVQFRQSLTIQTQTGVIIAPTTGTNLSPNWIEATGFDQLAVTAMTSASANTQVQVVWSHDGSSTHSQELLAPAGASQYKAYSVPVKAKYFKILFENKDASPVTAYAWAYLRV